MFSSSVSEKMFTIIIEQEMKGIEGTGGMEEGKEVKEVKNQGEKNYYETYQLKEVKEVENATEREDMKRKEWIRGEMENVEKGDTGEKLKDGKRNSFRLNYITHMIRR